MGIVCEQQELRMSQFAQRENVKFYQKLASEAFQMIKQAYSKKYCAVKLSLSGTNVLYTGQTVWKVMSIMVSQERSELNSSSKQLHRWCAPTTSKW
jgi:hypothetical protein